MDITTPRKRQKKKKRNKLSAAIRYGLAVAAVVLLGGALVLDAASKKKDREAAAVLAGTVFQSSGHLLRGAKVEAVAQDNAKIKSSTLTDAQGDFAIRVPAGGTYIVTASAKGFQAAQKTVEVYEGEKVRTNLMLSPEPKKQETGGSAGSSP